MWSEVWHGSPTRCEGRRSPSADVIDGPRLARRRRGRGLAQSALCGVSRVSCHTVGVIAGPASSVSLAFRKGPAPGTWLIEADGVPVGTVRRRETVLSNLGKSKRALNSRGVLWEATTEGAPLDKDDANAVQRHLPRQKTSRRAASEYL